MTRLVDSRLSTRDSVSTRDSRCRGELAGNSSRLANDKSFTWLVGDGSRLFEHVPPRRACLLTAHVGRIVRSSRHHGLLVWYSGPVSERCGGGDEDDHQSHDSEGRCSCRRPGIVVEHVSKHRPWNESRSLSWCEASRRGNECRYDIHILDRHEKHGRDLGETRERHEFLS